jgi:hypothetical protein
MGIACGKPAVVRLRRMSASHSDFMKRYLIPPFAAGTAVDIQFI